MNALGGRASVIALALAAVLAVGAVAWRASTGSGSGESAAADTSDPLAGLEAAARAEPGDAAAWQRLGLAHFDAGRYAEAAEAYASGAKAAPNNAALWSSLGEALVMGSKDDPMPPRALEAFRTAARIDAKDPRARYFLAVARDLEGDHAGAIDDWIALLKDTPAGAPWEADLKRTIEQVGKINAIPVEARIAAATAGRAAPPHPAFDAIPGPSQDQLAAAGSIPPGEQRAMAEGMVARLDARLASDPTNVDGWIMLMRSRKTLGQDAAASGALKKAVAANPARRSDLERAASQLGIAR